MRVRSTGLGKTEMVCIIGGVKSLDGHLMMTLEAIEPVKWHIRTVMTYKDILKLIRIGIFSILLYLITGVRTIFKDPPPPTDY